MDAFKFACNGDYYFAGSGSFRNAILNLEPDNPDNYVSTTNAEGETVEVYNGPTLDVKDRLLKVDAALTGLKAALVTTTDHASLKAALIAALTDL